MYASVNNPARGDEVDKHHPEGENVQRTPIQRAMAMIVHNKYSEKDTSPKKQKINKNKRGHRQLANCV